MSNGPRDRRALSCDSIMFLCLAPLLLCYRVIAVTFWWRQNKLIAFLLIVRALSVAELGISALRPECFFFSISCSLNRGISAIF